MEEFALHFPVLPPLIARQPPLRHQLDLDIHVSGLLVQSTGQPVETWGLTSCLPVQAVVVPLKIIVGPHALVEN